MTRRDLAGLIAKQPFFFGLTPPQIEMLAESAMRADFATGQVIFREGEPANRFYLMLEGKVVLECRAESGEVIPIQTVGPGEDLGWSWMFAPYYLHFSARAVEPAKAIFFYGTRLRQRCEEDENLGRELTRRIVKVVIQRLETMRKRLCQLQCL